MFQDDLLMRQIRQLAEAIAKALGVVAEGKAAQAEGEIDALCGQHTGLGLRTLAAMPLSQLRLMATTSEGLDPAKALTLATLLDGAAELYDRPELTERAAALRALSLQSDPSLSEG